MTCASPTRPLATRRQESGGWALAERLLRRRPGLTAVPRGVQAVQGGGGEGVRGGPDGEIDDLARLVGGKARVGEGPGLPTILAAIHPAAMGVTSVEAVRPDGIDQQGPGVDVEELFGDVAKGGAVVVTSPDAAAI